ncbi:MAG: TIGR01212 family radical SAM protein [Lentisphaeria bacterium]|nr:TIGR01212 family radical SAM protein [Lentisphaeria bacterium]
MTGKADEKPYYDFARFLREQYGGKVYRVPVDLDLGCPHRQGGQGGCTFCGERGARATHLGSSKLSLQEQVAKGVAFARERYGATSLIAYFQAFTSTNAPVETLRALYDEVLSAADFVGIAISTRPDCLPDDVMDYLGELSKKYDLWVELGVQSANDETLRRINRGHNFACSAQAVAALSERGIRVVAHVVLGLPGEDIPDYRWTSTALAALPFSGIKIHNLHVVKSTALAAEWREGSVRTMDEHEYGEVLIDFLRRIPSHWAILRMVTDTPREWLHAPEWWMSKGQFLQHIEKQMRLCGWHQGDLFVQAAAKSTATATAESRDKKGDSDTRCMPASAIRRLSSISRLRRFFEAADIPVGPPGDGPAVIDFGFGEGDLVLGVPQILAPPSQFPVHVAAVPHGHLDRDKVMRALPHLRPLVEGIRDSEGRYDWGELLLCRGDARQHLYRLRGRAEIILLEPPDVQSTPELFSLEFLRRLLRMLQPDGVVIASSGSSALRGALVRLGAAVGRIPGVAKSQGTVAALDQKYLVQPLCREERALLKRTLAGVPFRDHDLRTPRKKMLRHRDEVVSRLRKRGWKTRP